MSFLSQLLESHGDVIIDSLARQLDLPREQAEQVFAKTANLVLGGLARQSQTKGPEAVAKILSEHGNEAALEDPRTFLDQAAESGDPLGGLGSLLGGGGLLSGGLAGLFGGSIANLAVGALADFLNLEKAKAAKVLPMLVPLIMTSLSRHSGTAASSGLPEVIRVIEEEGDPGALEELASKVFGGGISGIFGRSAS